MDKTIEKPFLKAFEFGGVVHNCITVIRHKYDLGYLPQRTAEEEKERLSKLTPKEKEEQLKAEQKWQHVYDVKYPEIIKTETDAFDDTVIMYVDSPLMEEIEKNLLECNSQKEKDRYIFSLLKPFKEFSDIYHPKAEIDRLKAAIAECEKDKAMWEGMPEDKPLKDRTGKSAGTPREQAKACESFIDRYKEEIERCYYINRRFIELTCQPNKGSEQSKKGTVEWCLSAFVGVENMFANKLDALLLTYGIDLMRLQKESGIYLKSYRLITDVDFYIGSMELAKKYIDELPKTVTSNEQTTIKPQPEQTPDASLSENETFLPVTLRTERALKYFPKAIEANIVTKTDTGYSMGSAIKTKAILAYFLELVFCRDNTGKDNGNDFPETDLNTLFGESRLGKARGQYASNKSGKPKGYEIIDKIFE